MSHESGNNLFKKTEGYYACERLDILPYIPQTVKKTLEFGCGNGNFSALLKERFGAETWAVEMDAKAAQEASQRLDHVFQGDACAMMPKLPDDYFDCIVFLDLLEHLADPYTFLEDCKTKLAKGGKIVASIPNVRYYRAFKEYLFHAEWKYKRHGIMDITHLRFFTHKSIRRMFADHGYDILRIEGLHPCKSRGCFLITLLSLGFWGDIRFKHYAVVAERKQAD